MVTVIPRSEWGARYSNGAVGKSGPIIVPLPFSEWWLHHSVTIAPDLIPPFDDEYAAMRTLELIGQQRFAQGISYTFPIMPNGRVYEGHGIDRRGAHTGGRNDIARAICFVGNYDVTEPTAAQIESAAQLMVQEYRAGRAKTYRLNGGHRDLKATGCPGKHAYAAIPAINARAAAIEAGAPSIEEDPDMAFGEAERVTLNDILNETMAGRRQEMALIIANQAAMKATIDGLIKMAAADAANPYTLEQLRDAIREESDAAVERIVKVQVSVVDGDPAPGA